MKTQGEINSVLSSLADAMVLAHGASDDYTRGVMDFAQAAGRAFGDDLYFFAPAACEAIRRWEFQKTPAALVVIAPGGYD